MPKRPRTHIIDEQAQRIFRSLLPAEWILCQLSPDYGIDYEVEVVEDSSLTGLKCCIQLKGTSKAIEGTTIPFGLETDHLTYYVDKERRPVFLVLIDTVNSKGYYIFLQEHALYSIKNSNWRNKKTVTIKTPSINGLENSDRFRQHIHNADMFMSGLHPASVQTSLAHLTQKLESLDSRFTVRITASSLGEVHHELDAKEPVNLRFHFSGEPTTLKSKIEDLIGKGLPVSFGSDEFKIEGSKLLEELSKRGGILELASKQEIEIAISVVKGETTLCSIPPMVGTATAGIDQIRFTASLRDSPFTFSSALNRECPDQDPNSKFNFDFSRWCGQNIFKLAYFNQISSFIESLLNNGVCAKIEFLTKGNCILSGESCEMTHILANAPWFAIYVTIKKIREIARLLDMNISLPSLNDVDPKEIDLLHLILSKIDKPESPSNNSSFTISFGSAKSTEIFKNVNNCRDTVLELYRPCPIPRFLGHSINVGMLKMEIKSPEKLVVDKNEVTWELDSQSIFSISKADPGVDIKTATWHS